MTGPSDSEIATSALNTVLARGVDADTFKAVQESPGFRLLHSRVVKMVPELREGGERSSNPAHERILTGALSLLSGTPDEQYARFTSLVTRSGGSLAPEPGQAFAKRSALLAKGIVQEMRKTLGYAIENPLVATTVGRVM